MLYRNNRVSEDLSDKNGLKFQCTNIRYALSNRHFCDMLSNHQPEIQKTTSELLVNFKAIVCCRHVTAGRKKCCQEKGKSGFGTVQVMTACS